MKKPLPVCLSLAVMSLAFMANPAEAQLTVGQPAPKLQPGQWIQGEPVTAFDTNHVYIIEFWAAWNEPCQESIPHLNTLWEKFKDQGVVVIGQDVWDSDEVVVSFVKKMGDQMTYRVALDDKSLQRNGAMAQNWMMAADQHGIPTAFIIDKRGLIVWIGDPTFLNEGLLDKIVSGQYDLPRLVADYEEKQGADQRIQADQARLFSAINQKHWDEAEFALNDIIHIFPSFQSSFAGAQMEILLGQKKYTEAYKFADTFSDEHPTYAPEQNALAWILVTQPGIEHTNLALAEKLAICANQNANGTNAAILDTLARVQFMSGKTNDAIVTEQKAVNAASVNDDIGFLRKILSDYQQGKLPPVP